MSSKGKRYDKSFMVLAFLEVLFVAGFRIPLEGDSEWYTENFVRIAESSFRDVFALRFEEGFVVFCYLVSFISKTPQTIVFASTAFVTFFIFKYIYNNCKIPWLGVVLYVTFMFFFNAMNLMRFSLACSILPYANQYIIKRKFLKTLFIIFIASLFHFTAIIYIILYFAYPIRFSTKNILISTIVVVVISKLYFTLFTVLIQINPQYTAYADSSGAFYQSSFANILMCVIQVLVFVFCVKRSRVPLKALEGFNKLAMTALFIAVLFSAMAIDIMILTRFLTMFSIIEIIYIPNVLFQYYRTSAYYRHTLAFLLVTIAQVITILSFRPEWYAVLPYKNILFN